MYFYKWGDIGLRLLKGTLVMEILNPTFNVEKSVYFVLKTKPVDELIWILCGMDRTYNSECPTNLEKIKN